MQAQPLRLKGLVLVKPMVRRDERGFFVESWHEERYQTLGIASKFVQDNHSRSGARVLRGMHFQSQPGQAKLVRVISGKIFDVAVDIRKTSPTFGQWEGVYLDAQEHHQLFIPTGFAHGFCVVSESAEVLYKCSSYYDAAHEKGFAYNDARVGITWPVEDPIISERDRNAPTLDALPGTLLAT